MIQSFGIPATDEFLPFNYSVKNAIGGKNKNKEALCKAYRLNPKLPLIAFIGRFAKEKGADLLPEIVWKTIDKTNRQMNIMVLGSGDQYIENQLKDLNVWFDNFALELGYKEYLSHQIYASSDFLLMPSRVEPC